MSTVLDDRVYCRDCANRVMVMKWNMFKRAEYPHKGCRVDNAATVQNLPRRCEWFEDK